MAEAAPPSLEEASRWVGFRLDGIGNRAIGRVAGLLVDAGDGEPRWVMVRLGPLAGSTGLPFEHVAEGAGRLWAAYERDSVKDALRFNPDESLSAGQERELCAHWGIREGSGRTAELAGRDEDEVTAVPASSPAA
jgi:hypothetical protein